MVWGPGVLHSQEPAFAAGGSSSRIFRSGMCCYGLEGFWVWAIWVSGLRSEVVGVRAYRRFNIPAFGGFVLERLRIQISRVLSRCSFVGHGAVSASRTYTVYRLQWQGSK